MAFNKKSYLYSNLYSLYDWFNIKQVAPSGLFHLNMKIPKIWWKIIFKFDIDKSSMKQNITIFKANLSILWHFYEGLPQSNLLRFLQKMTKSPVTVGGISHKTIITNGRRQFDQFVTGCNWKTYSDFAVGMVLLNWQVYFVGFSNNLCNLFHYEQETGFF